MKGSLIATAVILVIGVIAFFVINKNNSQPHTTNSNQSNTNTNSGSAPSCTASNVKASGTFQVAAGNAYGTFVITNTSSSPCQIAGNNQLTMQYPNAVTNVKVTQTGQPTQNTFELPPNGSVYATVHYPNGPQCSSPIENPDVMFMYEIAPGVTVPFMNGTTTNPFEITTCQANSDVTTVEVSPFSTNQPPQ